MNRSTTKGLWRTNDVKFTTYQGDGAGRDSYIILNDGGLQPSPMLKGLAQKDDYNKSAKVYMQRPQGSLAKESSSVYYPPDGSGRDTYIIRGNGGTCTEYKIGKGYINFDNNDYLREKYSTPTMDKKALDKIPTMKNYNNWPSKEAIVKNMSIFKVQRNSIERLSPSPRQDFSKTDTGFFRNKKLSQIDTQKLDLIAKDPIKKEVEFYRQQQRAKSVLKSSGKMMGLQMSPDSYRAPRRLDDLVGYQPNNFQTVASVSGPKIQPGVGTFEAMLARRNVRNNSQFIKKKFVVGSLMTPSNLPVALEQIDAKSPLYSKKTALKKYGAVTKAAYPAYAGFPPEYEANTQASSNGIGLTQKNNAANQRARTVLRTGNFNIAMPRELNSPAKRRMDAVEYRGPNMSDCMYHTMQSFNKGRENVSPMNQTSKDWNVPRGGINLP